MSFSSTSDMCSQFKRKLKANSIAFFMPNGFVVWPSFLNADLPNEFTISKSLVEFEIRYSVHPLKQELSLEAFHAMMFIK